MAFPTKPLVAVYLSVAVNAVLWLDSFDRYMSTRYHVNLTSALPEWCFIPSQLIENDIIQRGEALILASEDAKPATPPEPQKVEAPSPATEVSAPEIALVPPVAQPINPPVAQPIDPPVAALNEPARSDVAPAPPPVTEPRILFAGDSMMQGVAPLVISRIKKENSHAVLLDLSKQSTGLTVRRYFDWPTKIREEATKRELTSVVIFLGPNDPWDITEGKDRYAFPSPEWEDKYRERVTEVLRFANERNIRVVWIGLPSMKNERVKKGAIIQNRIFREECARFNSTFLDTEEMLGRLDQPFSKYIPDETKGQVLVRAEDGTHFTPHGLRLIAGKLVEILNTQKQG